MVILNHHGPTLKYLIVIEAPLAEAPEFEPEHPVTFTIYWQYGMLPFVREPQFTQSQGACQMIDVMQIMLEYIADDRVFLVEINGDMNTWEFHFPDLMNPIQW